VLLHFLQALHDTAAATAIREGEDLFPWIESVHVLAVTLVIGSIAVVDLRLLGWSSRDRSVMQMTALVLPVTWCAFAIAVISGALLFSSNALAYARNPFLQVKLLLILGAGLNMTIFHLYSTRGADSWLTPALTPRRAQIAGAISLALWIAIAACGRWIGFTLQSGP
jgi:uncharacterized membrane protein